jgi:choice-of-anchor B domain-containing protein
VLATATSVAANPGSANIGAANCVNGLAGDFPCKNVDLLSVITLEDGNDLWGWTDPATGREIALVGLVDGTAFVDITDPESPVHLGSLPTHTTLNWVRDIKVFDNHAFIVAGARSHGMQVFDLTQLRDVQSPPETFTATAHYSQFGDAHNIAINEESGFAYVVLAHDDQQGCGEGLHMVDIRDAANPVFAGCFSADGATHDTQCVNYSGPDTDYVAKEICFNSNIDTLTIVDVTDKSAPALLSRTGHVSGGFAHQGWLTAGQNFFLLDDEADEERFGHNTRTYVWDVSDLDAPFVTGFHESHLPSRDHNLYIKGGFVYQANYVAGLRILDIGHLARAQLSEVAYFDTVPETDGVEFFGAWSVFPFFESGVVIVNTFFRGLFVLRPRLCRGRERIKKPLCGEPGNRLKLKLVGGLRRDRFRAELSTGEIKEGKLKEKGRKTVRFKDLPSGPAEATVTWECGTVAKKRYTCP